METQEQIKTNTPIEERVLALTPDKFYTSMMTRRARLAEIAGGARPKTPQEVANLQRDIKVLRTRAEILQKDSSAATLEEVEERLQKVKTTLEELERDKKADWFIRQGAAIRTQVLQTRAERIRKNGPVMRVIERRKWKAEEKYSGRALPPDQWEQLSPRLVANPDATLNETEELNWYIQTLSPKKQREVRALSSQMKPIDDNVRAVVIMPAKMEGIHVYRTLSNYVGQKELKKTGETAHRNLDYRKLRIVLFDNWMEGTAPDNTKAEVERFMMDHPEVQVDLVRGEFEHKADGHSPDDIGNIRNVITAAVIDNAAKHRKKPAGDLIYISNDGDMPKNAIASTYVADMIDEFDRHPKMDALAGNIDFPENLMAQLPIALATRRLWQYMTVIRMHKKSGDPFMVGRNSAMRFKMLAAVGNYDCYDKSGEDVEIGNKVKWARSWDIAARRFNKARIIHESIPGRPDPDHPENRVRYVHRLTMVSDPRRDFIRLIKGQPIFAQYWNFKGQERMVRGRTGEELANEAVQVGFYKFDRNRFQFEATPIYFQAKKEGKLEEFSRAMGLVGAKWEERGGKFVITDTTALEKNIQELRFREHQQTRIENWLNIKVKSVDIMRSGQNNQVFSIITIDGRRLIIRTSSEKTRSNKFEAERWAMEQSAAKGVPTSRIVAIDTSRKILPDRIISVSETLQGNQYSTVRLAETSSPAYLRQVGQALRRIHAVQTNGGYGFIDEKGTGNYPDWESFVMRAFVPDKFQKMVQSGLLNQADLDAVIVITQRAKTLLANAPRQLIHGDFALNNTIAQAGNLSGVIDFENAKSGDGLWDIAHFFVYDQARIGAVGVNAFLEGYGNPDMLKDPIVRQKVNLYKIANIMFGLEWYSYQPGKEANIRQLTTLLQSTMAEMQSSLQIPTTRVETVNIPNIKAISRSEINAILGDRFRRAVDWFREFYTKGRQQDQEYIQGLASFQRLKPQIETLIKKGDVQARDQLVELLLQSDHIADSGFSRTEIARLAGRLINAYRRDATQFAASDHRNPSLHLLLYLRNRGKLERYEKEYANLPPEVNFRKIVMDMARAKAARGETLNILDEGGTYDVALQQLTGAVMYNVPSAKVKLASTAADNFAVDFADCHKYPVEHKMVDVHDFNRTFGGEKRSLIISQAAYKFFWDPIGAAVQSANALENGGWAFLGDIRDRPSYRLFDLFRDENGQPLDPQQTVAYLNSLKLGYTFYTGMHTSTRDGYPTQVMTLAIHKETDADLNLPMYYAQKTNQPPSDWLSPLVYIVPKTAAGRQKCANLTKV